MPPLMPTVDWAALARSMDAAVDQVFACKIDLLPWKQGADRYVGRGAADPDRAARLNLPGIFMSKHNMAETMPHMASKIAEADRCISVPTEVVGDLTQADRVIVHHPFDGDTTNEVTWIDHGDTGRAIIYLVGVTT